MKALVTGASGFIGRNILSKLKSVGNEVVGIDFSPFKGVIVRDIRSKLDDLMHGVDYVFHEAAMTSPPQFEELAEQGLRTNILGTYNVLTSAAKAGVSKAIIASSSSIYGTLDQPAVEDLVASDFQNLYPLTKVFGESLAKYFKNREELEVVSLRYFNTYGKDENSKGFYSSVISKFIEDVKKDIAPTIFGDGTQSRDFIYVKDVVEANLLAMENGKRGEAYNVGTGHTTDFKEVSRLVLEALGSDLTPKFVSNPFKNYQNYTLADITKSQRELRFKAKYTLKDGIADILEGY